MNKKPLFKEFNNIYNNAKILDSIKDTCDILDQLNSHLYKCIPEPFIGLCHFGAIDKNTNIPTLYINEPQIFHKLHSMSEHILRYLSSKGFIFDGILFKTKPVKNNLDLSPQYKNLNKQDKNQLQKLAQLINKPQLVLDILPTANNDVEIEL